MAGQDFSLYDPQQFQNMLTGNTMSPYQSSTSFNPSDPFGVQAAFAPGGYDPGQFNFPAGNYKPPDQSGMFSGLNMGNIGQGITMVSSLFDLYGGIKSLGLMSKQFKLAKKATKLGINNQTTAYNNTVEGQEAAERASFSAGAGQAPTADFERMKKWGE